MNREQQLRSRLKWLTWLFIAGLVISGATAMPLTQEVDWLVERFGCRNQSGSTPDSQLASWLLRVQDALHETEARRPFMFYGMDWLAFGHFVIAVAFVGALRDPVRNRWLYDFGLIACLLVIPFALVCGQMRGIPVWWRLIDCSFGIFGFVPLWFCRRWSLELES